MVGGLATALGMQCAVEEETRVGCDVVEEGGGGRAFAKSRRAFGKSSAASSYSLNS